MRILRLYVWSALLTGLLFPKENSAQPWMKRPLTSGDEMVRKRPNLQDLSARFNEYWNSRTPSIDEGENAEEGGYQQFRRWEWFMKQRTWPSGDLPDPNILFREWKRTRDVRPVNNARMQSTNWTYVGPDVVPANGGGAGRVNVLRFNPVDNNILYLGSASGGLWKSIDGGSTWTALDDFLTALSVADIAINPRYPDSIYVATGDGYGYEVNGDFWGGTYSAGILVSPDGGVTWNPTGIAFTQDQNNIVQRLTINPQDPSIMLAATRYGLFRSTDAGVNWNSVRTSKHYDIEWGVGNPAKVFATTSSILYVSYNYGATWSPVQGGLCGGRSMIGTCEADSNRVYVLCENGNLWRSDDAGDSFTATTDPSSLVTFYGYYDGVLAVSPTDPDVVICAGMNIGRSDDGGQTWYQIGNMSWNDYIHVDNHSMDFAPGNGNIIFSGNDGGLFRSTNGGATWTDLSDQLHIKQYYRMGQSATNAGVIYAGAQDNGTDRLANGNWTQVFGADGMDCMVDYTDDDIAYVSYQYGALQRSTDGGNNFNDIAPSSGEWVTPFAIDPVDHNTIYAGYDQVYKSTNRGTNWNTIGPVAIGGGIIALAIAPSNPNYIYTAALDRIYMTSNGGASWNNITTGLPVGSTGITYIAISNQNPQQVWVTLSGYQAGIKVFSSVDGGSTWSNVSGTLPNIPVNCIVYQNGSNDALYIGTDFGVYYRDATLTDWVPYGNDLPNVIVSDMEIYYAGQKLRAATYGRGIWEVDLNPVTALALDAAVIQFIEPAATICSNSVTPVIVVRNNGSDALTDLNINYRLDGGTLQSFAWSGNIASGDTAHVTLPLITVTGGSHSIYAATSDPNGQADQQPANDGYTYNISVNTSVANVPQAEGFEAFSIPADWVLDDAAGMLSYTTSASGFGLSGVSLKVNYFFSSPGATSSIEFPHLDFSAVTNPVYLDFNVAYAVFNATSHDSLKVLLSLDCGETFTAVYAKGDNSLATAPQTMNEFTPDPTQWRAERVDLSAYAGNPNVLIRFQFISGYGNHLYVDDINLYDNTSATPEVATIAAGLYPNPTSGEVVFSFRAPDAGDYRLELVDVSGRVVKLFSNLKAAELSAYRVDLTGETAGIYFYRLMRNDVAAANGRLVKF